MSITPRDELSARAGVDLSRLAKEGAGSAVYTMLVLLSLGLALALAYNFRTTWDFTKQRSNSLSPKTLEALAGLEAPVGVHGLLRDADRRRDGYWDLLELYRRKSDRVSVEIFDPNSRPGALEKLGLSAEDRNTIRDGITVVTSGDRKVLFRGFGEEDVTNAILEVGSSKPRVIGFIRGYGERDPNSTEDAGLSRLRDALRGEYYELADVRLDAPISDTVTLLVAAGPEAAIPKADLDRLAAWLERGGRLLVLLDPRYDSGLGTVVERWGLRTAASQVFDRRSNLRGQPDVPLGTDYSNHAAVRGFSAGLPVALPIAVAVEDFDANDPALFHEYLVKSSVNSEGLTPDGTRTQGPFALAAASWKPVDRAVAEGSETRVVMIGNAAFATNGFLAEASNRNFLLNCVGWLSRSRAMVAIRQDTLGGQVLKLRRGDFNVFQALLAGPLVVVVIAGVVVFVRRRGL